MKRKDLRPINRRDFLISSATLAGALPALGYAAARPCPPSTIAVSGGASTSTSCDASSGQLPLLNLIGASSAGTHPWTVGHGFRKGDVPADSYLTATGPSHFQAEIRNRWKDGSVKFAVLSGIGGTSVQLAKTGSAPASEPLTLNQLRASIGAGSITVGSQSFSLADLVAGSPQKVVFAGPVMSNWIFRRPLEQGNDVSLWLDVRLYVNGQCELFPWVENAFLLTAAPASFLASNVAVVINGETVFSKTNLDFKARTRIPLLDTSAAARPSFSYWTGKDPGIYPQHDTAYLMASKLTPNWPFGATNTAFTFIETYTPNMLGNTPAYMPGTGSNHHIGPLPAWSAAYLASNADPRGYRGMMANGLSAGSWSLHYRNSPSIVDDEATGAKPLEVPTYLQYPKIWTNNNGSTPIIPAASGGTNGNATPDQAHQPAIAYLPYLVTGRWWFLDELLMWDYWNYASQNFQYRNYAQALMNVTSQIRGFAWLMRTRAHALGIVPADHHSLKSIKGSWEATMSRLRAQFVDGTYDGGVWKNSLGCLGLYSSAIVVKDGVNVTAAAYSYACPVDETNWWDSPWQQSFVSLVLGMSWDLELPQSAQSELDHRIVRDFSYIGPVQRAGDGSPGTYSYRRFGIYRAPYCQPKYSSYGKPYTPTGWFKNWGEIAPLHEKMGTGGEGGAGCFSPLAPLDGGNTVTYGDSTIVGDLSAAANWGNTSAVWPHLVALVYAKDHSYPGAAEGFARIAGSTSYQQYAVACWKGYPAYGIGPRS